MSGGRIRWFLLVVLMLVAVAGSACGRSGDPAPAAPRPAAASPPPASPALRALERQRNRLLDGGSEAFKRRLAALRGHPVVVNQWASWCPPCRAEFPFFQRLAGRYRGEVAFLGVDSRDNRGHAEKFLAKFPTPYPHYFDESTEVARVFGGGRAWPTTAYYDRSGERAYIHQGGYATQAKLDEDVRRYALGG